MFGIELYTPEYKVAGDEVAIVETSKGTIKVELDGAGAPIHVANFCELSTMGFYDGLKFHRYVPGFVIQGGDRNSHDDGALAMARSMNPDSAGSQVYFCLGAQHNLDSGYTVFGQTLEGKDVIAALRAGDEIVHIDIVHKEQ